MDWSVMPSVVAEGRRVLGNIERVSDVFLTKTSYAVIISLITGLSVITHGFDIAFPFLPRHLSLIGALTIGIPAFFLALEPNHQQVRPNFLRRVLGTSVPPGLIIALATMGIFSIVQIEVSDARARTVAVMVNV